MTVLLCSCCYLKKGNDATVIDIYTLFCILVYVMLGYFCCKRLSSVSGLNICTGCYMLLGYSSGYYLNFVPFLRHFCAVFVVVTQRNYLLKCVVYISSCRAYWLVGCLFRDRFGRRGNLQFIGCRDIMTACNLGNVCICHGYIICI